MDRRAEPHRSKRLERAKEDIVRRLRSICAGMSDAEFDALAEQMAELEIKYALRREKFDIRPMREHS